MAADNHSSTLGAAFFVVILALPGLWDVAATALRQPIEGAQSRLLLPSDVRPQQALALGWRLPVGCSDPLVWEALPGVGPSLAARLVRAVERGELLAPSDLLRVRGIGVKMASRLEARLDWRRPFELKHDIASTGDHYLLESCFEAHLHGSQCDDPCRPRSPCCCAALLQRGMGERQLSALGRKGTQERD